MATESSQENGFYTYDSFTGNNQKPVESNFLWWCAGAHQKLLKKFPSEHTKYAGLGGVLLATLVLAAISAGYAIYSVFGSLRWMIVFAVVLGINYFQF
jgi:hypothetical protein